MVMIPGGSTVTPLSSPGGGGFATPFQFYLTNAENIRISSVNAVAGVRIKVQGRILKRGGAPEWFSFDHTPNTDRSLKNTDHPLGEGFILNLVAFAEGTAPKVGQTFVQVKVIGGLSGATMTLGTLLQGYVTTTQELAWPGSPIQSSIEGGGVIRVVQGTSPAPGVEVTEVVPTGARWQLLWFFVRLVTSATVADRIPMLQLADSVIFMRSRAMAPVPASKNTRLTWYPGAVYQSDYLESGIAGALPESTILLEGQTISTATIDLQADDDYAQPALVVREWLEVQ